MNLLVTAKTLVLGVGGGYDIYTALPWYFSLSSEEQSLCILANYSFTEDLYKYENYIVPIVPSTTRTEKNKDYFPEHDLAKFINSTVYAIRLIPAPLLITELRKFIDFHHIEHIYLFDGGTDSILYGDELLWGSPLEDSQTILACYKLGLPCRLFVSAFNIDDCDSQAYLRHWKSSKNSNKITLGPHLSGWDRYVHIVQTLEYPSIIQESIIAAAQGHRGVYKNNRIYPSRVSDPEDLPLIVEDTDKLWEWDLNDLVENSLFYQKLLEHLQTNKHSDDINVVWINWSRLINNHYSEMVRDRDQ